MNTSAVVALLKCNTLHFTEIDSRNLNFLNAWSYNLNRFIINKTPFIIIVDHLNKEIYASIELRRMKHRKGQKYIELVDLFRGMPDGARKIIVSNLDLFC